MDAPMPSIERSSITTVAEPPAQSRQSLESEQPWRYIGYRGYSRFVASDGDLFILRRFSVLNARVALSLQHELVILERQLDKLDDKYEDDGTVHNGRFDGDEEDRVALLSRIEEKLRKYNKFVMQQSAMQKYKSASESDIKSMFRWHHNHGFQAVDPREQQYLHYGRRSGSPYTIASPETDGTKKLKSSNDLVSVVHRDKTPLRRVIDRSRSLRTLSLWKEKRGDVPEYDAEEVTYYSERRVDAFVSFIIFLIGIAMLMTPIWILHGTQLTENRLAVISVFIIVFLLVLSFGMVAKPFEALGATAGYAAVLMVFLQLSST